MTATKTLVALFTLFVFMASAFGPVSVEGYHWSYVKVEMLALNTTVLPGSGDAIAVVHTKLYEWVPVFDRFNFSELNRYNLTSVLSDTVYVFYMNSSGAYLLYKGDEEGAPIIRYSEKRRTWYFRFHLGEVNPLFTAFLRSKGYNANRSLLEGYLAFNGSQVWAVGKPTDVATTMPGILTQDATTLPGYPYVEGIRVGSHYFVNFTVDYSSPAYAHSQAGYSWTVPEDLVRRNLGLSAPVLTMAVPDLINCTEGTFKGEEYCFPVDKPEWMYLYHENLRIVYHVFYSGNESGEEVHRWNRTVLMAWTRWDRAWWGKAPANRTIRLMGEDLIPLNSTGGFNEYRVALYNFTTNTTQTFSLLKIPENSSTVERTEAVKVFRPKVLQANTSPGGALHPAPPCEVGEKTGRIFLYGLIPGLILGALIGYGLGRKRHQKSEG